MSIQKPPSPYFDEIALRNAIHSTLHAATRPSPHRLRQLMPPIPQQKRGSVWMRQLAPIAALLLLMLGGFGMRHFNGTAVWTIPSPTHLASPTHIASTATMTNAPTATVAQTKAATGEAPAIQATPIVMRHIQPVTAVAPLSPTPIAMNSHQPIIQN